MIASAVRICAMLALLAGCTSTDEAPPTMGNAGANAAMGAMEMVNLLEQL